MCKRIDGKIQKEWTLSLNFERKVDNKPSYIEERPPPYNII